MANEQSIEAVLFDLGDTLIQFGRFDREQIFRRAVRHTYRMWARRQTAMPDLRRYYLHQWFAVRWGFIKAMLRNREVDAIRLMRRACRKLSLEAPDEFFAELTWAWYQPLANIATIEPGTHRTLAHLRTSGYKLAIISNTFVPGYVLDRHLDQLDLLQFFPHRVYSYDVAYRKPNPRIFQIALDRLAVTPASAVFVGDLLRTDIRGAQRLGIRGILKRSEAVSYPIAHPLTIDRLTQLPALLRTLTPYQVNCA